MTLNLLHKQRKIENIPEAMQKEIDILRATKSKSECLRACYDFMNTKYRGSRIKTITRLFELPEANLDTLWAKNGFLHCTTLNYLMQVCLIKSGHFTAADISFHWTHVNYLSPHQYLKVRVAKDTLVDVDIWGSVYGVKFGDHAHGFHTS